MANRAIFYNIAYWIDCLVCNQYFTIKKGHIVKQAFDTIYLLRVHSDYFSRATFFLKKLFKKTGALRAVPIFLLLSRPPEPTEAPPGMAMGR